MGAPSRPCWAGPIVHGSRAAATLAFYFAAVSVPTGQVALVGVRIGSLLLSSAVISFPFTVAVPAPPSTPFAPSASVNGEDPFCTVVRIDPAAIATLYLAATCACAQSITAPPSSN